MGEKTKTALIIGASGGIGSAIADQCVRQGYKVLTLSRSVDGFDITDEETVQKAAKATAGGLDLIVVATGGLEVDGYRPEKTIQSMTAKSLGKYFETNAVGPALILKYFSPKLTKVRRSVIVVLSARIGSISDNLTGGWISFRASKAALNQIVRTASMELERKNPQAICVAYHPGTVGTKLTKKYVKNRPAVSPESAAHDFFKVLDSLTVLDTGYFLDWAGKPVIW